MSSFRVWRRDNAIINNKQIISSVKTCDRPRCWPSFPVRSGGCSAWWWPSDSRLLRWLVWTSEVPTWASGRWFRRWFRCLCASPASPWTRSGSAVWPGCSAGCWGSWDDGDGSSKWLQLWPARRRPNSRRWQLRWWRRNWKRMPFRRCATTSRPVCCLEIFLKNKFKWANRVDWIVSFENDQHGNNWKINSWRACVTSCFAHLAPFRPSEHLARTGFLPRPGFCEW